MLAVLVLLVGAGIMAYPAVSDRINRINGSYAIQSMQQQVDMADQEELARQLALAMAYNEGEEDCGVEYQDILNYGDGIMGQISIPAIHVSLPIYHGVGSEVLSRGVGHLPESDFPIGGEGTHAVLTGHTGFPGARLFTDLTELKEGDVFTVTIQDRQTDYQVDSITVVSSDETEALAAEEGEDYCTLVTCTPYGVNSHRLLVRGSRIQKTQNEFLENPGQEETGDCPRWMWAGVPLPLIVLAVWKIRAGRRSRS